MKSLFASFFEKNERCGVTDFQKQNPLNPSDLKNVKGGKNSDRIVTKNFDDRRRKRLLS